MIKVKKQKKEESSSRESPKDQENQELEIYKSLFNFKDEAYFRYQLLLELSSIRKVILELARFLKEESNQEEEDEESEEEDYESEFNE